MSDSGIICITAMHKTHREFPTNHIQCLPCKKCDMDFHGNSLSQLDLVAVWSKSTPNSMTFPCHLSRFYLFSMLDHDMDFGQVMEFPGHSLRK